MVLRYETSLLWNCGGLFAGPIRCTSRLWIREDDGEWPNPAFAAALFTGRKSVRDACRYVSGQVRGSIVWRKKQPEKPAGTGKQLVTCPKRPCPTDQQL